MKRIFIALLWWGWMGMGNAQIITITDKQTHEPMKGVVLISESKQASVVTNARGQAEISAFAEAANIQIRHLGYQRRVLSFRDIEEANFKIALLRSSLNLNQVVVSATRWRQTTQNVPSKIATISAKEVALQNPQTAADLLGISGKVFIQKSQQGGGSPMIRGFATNRLIYTIDGVRMNTAIFRGGNLQNIISLDPFATENTEVLFGPGSVIYGSDAIGGVMSFNTLTPQFSLSEEPLITGKAVTRYSSANNEKTGHIDVNVGWEKWALVTSFSTWDYDHLRQGSNGPNDYVKNYYPQRQDSGDVLISQDDELLQIPSAYSQINMMQKLRFKPSKKWDFQYGFHYSETSPYGRYDRHNRLRNGTARYAEWNYGPQKWLMNHLAITHEDSNGLYDKFSLRLAQQAFEESRISRNFNSMAREVRIEEVDAYSLNLDFTKNRGKRHTLYYGLEYVRNEVFSRGSIELLANKLTQSPAVTKGPSRYPQANWNSMAAYLNDEFRVSENFTLQAGLRYNHFSIEADFRDNLAFFPFPFTTAKLNNGALTGSIGAVYRPSDTWVIKGSLGTAFRAPNVDDIGKVFDSEPGAVVVPNPNLNAEYAYNVDLGVAKVFGNAVKLDVTAYYTSLQNALVRRDFQLNGRDSIVFEGVTSKVQANQNAASASVFGLQAGLEVKFPQGFTLLSDLNVQDGEEELNDGSISPSRHAAPLFGVSRLRYTHQNFTLELNVRYQARRNHQGLSVSERDKVEIYALDAKGNTFSPAWYTLNLKTQYRLSPQWSLSGGVENLSDQRYRPYSSGLSGAGRNFVLSLRADF